MSLQVCNIAMDGSRVVSRVVLFGSDLYGFGKYSSFD